MMINASLINRVFELNDVYFDIIEKHAIHPRGEAQHAIFCPPVSMLALDDRVFAAHVTELLDRVRDDNPLSFATDAELLVILKDTSLAAPLTGDADTLYCRLYQQIIGEIPYKLMPAMAEMYTGSVQELYIEMKKKHRKEGRKWVTT